MRGEISDTPAAVKVNRKAAVAFGSGRIREAVQFCASASMSSRNFLIGA